MKNKIQKIFAKAKNGITEENPSWYFDAEDERKFFFMHIPKTAGTTFRKILYRHAPKNYLWPDQKFLIHNGLSYPKQKELLTTYKSHLDKKIIIGHYNMNLLKHTQENTIVLTFIRNPYERVLSHIKHLCALEKIFKGDPNLVVEKRLNHILHVQCKMLGFKPHNRQGTKNLIATIERINFIGLTEEFDKSIALCNKMFNWKLELIQPQNERKDEIIKNLTAINKSKIIQHLIPEIRAYSNAHKKFNSLCKEYGI